MKKESIINCFKFLNELSINKITNKDTKADILSNILQMNNIYKEYESGLDIVRKKLFEGKDKEIQELSELREKYSKSDNKEEKTSIVSEITSKYSDILKLEEEFSNIMKNITNETIDLNLRKIQRSKFLEACNECGIELSLSDLIPLKDILN